MKKVILNGCFGGYGWSKRGVTEVLKKKGFNDLHYFLGSQYDDKHTEVGYREFCDDDGWEWFIRVIPGDPYAEFDDIREDFGDDEEKFDEIYETVYNNGGFNRDDPDAIWVLEKFGSEFCSGDCALLMVSEYDDDLFLWEIDEYDGSESLRLIPNITKERILACGTLENVVELLKKTGVILRK